MIHISQEIEKLLLHPSIYDSSAPLIPYCVDDVIFYDFLISISQKYNTENKLYSYYELAHLIRCHPSDEYEKTFTPSKFQECFKFYMYSWGRLGAKRVPLAEWIDLAEEGLDILWILINENKLENFKKDIRFKKFMEKYYKRQEDLRLSGKYLDLNEFMDS